MPETERSSPSQTPRWESGLNDIKIQCQNQIAKQAII